MMPKRFRDRLARIGDTTVWITNAMDGPDHLDVLPNSSFEALGKKIGGLTNDRRVLAFKRYYFGAAVPVDIDAAGRILVPAALRQRCGLADKIAFVGLDEDRFQLWSPAGLDASFAEASENVDEILAHLADLGV